MSLNFNKAKSLLNALKRSIPDRNRWVLPDLSVLPEVSNTKEAEYVAPIDIPNSVLVLSKYGVSAVFKDYVIGPSVTTFIYEIPAGTKLGNLERYLEDLARDLGVDSVRVTQAPGYSSCIGIEVENLDRYPVSFRSLALGNKSESKLSIPLGEDTMGVTHYIDISKQPHIMVAGQTGSGKSVFLNTAIASLISRNFPNELKLLLVDPKQVEFSQYANVPHLIGSIANSLESAYEVVDYAVNEMERRFTLLNTLRVKKIEDFNEQIPAEHRLPYIVLVVDEFADLMMMGTSKERKEVEGKIVRVAQKARAVGIHLILATQKPLATVVTSLIKANMPAQVAFKVQKSIDSKVILDEVGAEHLSGKGDLLFTGVLSSGKAVQLKRVQAPFLSDEDLETIIEGGRYAK